MAASDIDLSDYIGKKITLGYLDQCLFNNAIIKTDISGDGGLLKKILTEGTGDATPESGMEISAHYTGTLDDGTKFDSSRDRGTVFKFQIGQGRVIKGWDQGFLTMKKGEKAILRCRYHIPLTCDKGRIPNCVDIADLITRMALADKGRSPQMVCVLWSNVEHFAEITSKIK